MATADSVVLELEVRTGSYGRDLNKAAAQAEASMSRVEKAASAAEAKIQDAAEKSARSILASAERVANRRQRLADQIKSYSDAEVATELRATVRRQRLADQVKGYTDAQIADQLRATAATEAHSGRAANATRNLGRQVADIGTGIASQQSPFLILAQQAPQVADALADTGGKAAAVAGFFAGPWGAALLAAGSVAGVLLGKVLETGDALDDQTKKLTDNAEKTRIADQAKEAFSHTLAGVEQALREEQKALDASSNAYRSEAERTEQRTRVRLAELAALQATTRARLADAIAQEKAINAGSASGDDQLQLSREQEVHRLRVVALEEELAKVTRDQAQANEQLNRSLATQVVEYAKIYSDGAARINSFYDRQIEGARKAATATDIQSGALRRQVDHYNALRDAALKAASAEGKRSPSAIGRDVDVAGATAIIAGIGGHVTSGLRSNEKQAQLYADKLAGRHIGPVAAPGTSAHERGQAIDVAFGPGISVQSIKRAFDDAGVAIRKILPEPTQRVFHVEFGKAGKSAEALARETEATRQRALRDDSAYANEKSGLNAEYLSLQRQGVTDVQQLADLAKDQVDVEAAKKVAGYRSLELEGHLTKARADELAALAGRNADLKRAAIDQDAGAALTAQGLQSAQGALRNQQDLLEGAKSLAENSDERKRLDLLLLDLKYQQLRLEQQSIIDSATANDAQKELARAILASLPKRQANDKAGIDNQYRGAYETYRKGLAGDFTTIQESVDAIKVDALKRLEDSLVSSATAALGLKGALGEVVGQIIRIGIERKVLGPIADALFGKADGSTGGVFGGLLGKIFGGGKSTVTSSYAQLPAIAGLERRATGGLVAAGQAYVVGEHGPELFAPNAAGRIIPDLRAGKASARSGGNTVIQQFTLDARGGVVTQDLLKYTNEVGRQAAVEGARAGHAAVFEQLGAMAKPKL